MKRKLCTIVFCMSFVLVSSAQSSASVANLADVVIGWRNKVKPPSPIAVLIDKPANNTFTIPQVKFMYDVADWMQQSWTPKGVLGYAGIVYKMETKSKTRSFTKYENAPHGYGAYGNNYIFLKKDANGKYVNTTTHNDKWSVIANGVEPFTSLSMLNTTDEYYFFIPKVEADVKSHYQSETHIRQSKLHGFDTHPNLTSYTHFYVPIMGNNSDRGTGYAVILAKDNHLPFEEVTIGEVLQQAEKAAEVNRVRSIERSNRNNKEEQKNIQEAFNRNTSGLEKIKSYYKSKLSTIAKVSSRGLSIESFSVGGGGYMADDNLQLLEQEFTVYKISKKTKELCRVAPQWVTITFSPGLDNHAYSIHRMKTIMSNFDYEYLYNYAFYPEKINAIAYKSLQDKDKQLASKLVNTTTASQGAIDASNNQNILFFDDFSTAKAEEVPPLWTSNVFMGTTAKVKEEKGLPGKWLELRQNYIAPKNLKYPLPEEFEWNV